MSDEIKIYAMGLVAMSLCAPASATREAIEAEANLQYPTGISSRWQIADGEAFSDGTPMPCPCPDDAGRQHWLLLC